MRHIAARRRMAKLDRLTGPALPRVIEVASDDETIEAAIERFVTVHGRAPSSCIIVPARATEDELPALEVAWREQQRRLVADARTKTQKLKEATNVRHSGIRTIQHAPGGNGLRAGHRTPVATRRMGGEG